MPRLILVVDDIRSNREILKNILGQQYEIVEASNGQEAMDIMKKQYSVISAVLLDLGMPVMDGFQVLSEMGKSDLLSQLPVIVTTGQTDSESEERALQLGAKDYISKPYKSAIIRQRIWNTISLRENAAMVNALKYDSLTGLYSREAFFEKVSEKINAHEPGYYTMTAFDIDNFKVINDQYGTDKGDEILRHIANVFKTGFQPYDGICCRMMADNFAVLYPASLLDADEIKKIRQEAEISEGMVEPITFSIGRYIVNDLSLSPSSMYDRASLAEQSIKGKYDMVTALYEESMRERLINEQRIVTDMKMALSEGQFEVWFQPQYNHSTGALVGAEALVRWRHPIHGLISPAEFIPIFERNGFVYELDKYVWENVCICLKKWIDENRNPLPVSVNISRHDIFHPELFSVLKHLVKKYNIPVELLRLEITESAFTESSEQIIEIVKKLVSFGFTVEIDDFGSGYSSLNTLKSVPAQVVKLDMRFLEDGDGTQRGGNILESIIRMTKWLGMSVIAEGVEEKRQADFLKSVGCSYIQGFLYAKPMPLIEYEKHCEKANKEERLLAMETVTNLDNNAFWDPKSMDTLIFNSYVGAACIFEYFDGYIELLRANDRFTALLGDGTMTTEDVLKLDWISCLDKNSLKLVRHILKKSGETGEDFTDEFVFLNIPGSSEKTYLRATMRVIASVGGRLLVYCISENITAQREAEQREHYLAQQMQAIMDNVGVGITATIIKERDVELLFANEKYFEMRGYTRENFHDQVKNPFLLISEEDRDRVAAEIKEVIDSGRPIVTEYRALHREGREFWIRMDVSMGKFEGVSESVQLAIFRDITDERKAIEKLRISEEENRLATIHTGSTICRYNIADKTLTVPPRSRKSFFSSLSVVENVPHGPVEKGEISQDTAKEYIAFYESIAKGKETGTVTYQRKSDKGWRWLEAHFSTLFSSNGEPVSAVVSFMDVTDQIKKEIIFRKWEQSLKDRGEDSYTLFRCNLSRNSSFDSREGSLLIVEFDHSVCDFNHRTAEYVKQCVYSEDKEKYTAFLDSDSLLAGYYRGRRFDTLEYREFISETGLRWLRLTVELVEYPNSTDIEAYLMYENIDQAKRSELLTIEKAETDPLTGVLNRTTFISKVDEIMSQSHIRSEHALLMIDIDGFKQVNDAFGHHTGDKTLVDISESLKKIIREQDLIGRLGGDEYVVFLRDVPNEVFVAQKAREICKATRRALSVEVGISGSIGIALTPKDGNDFDSLYKKADSALYYVKGCGKDSYAFYYEDMADEHFNFETELGLNDHSTKKEKRRMLIVDDSQIDHAMMSNIFSQDFIVEKASDGKMALIRLRHYGGAISVVLLDLMMPGMDGFAVLKKMQESTELSKIPVIVVSGDETRDTSLRAIRSGAVDFVTKPIDAEILKIRVQSAISKAENERLRLKNSFLEYENSQVLKYKTILEGSGTLVIEIDWLMDSFVYDPNMTKYLAGKYDKRSLWHILLADFVADTQTVKEMQTFVHNIVGDKSITNGCIDVKLKTISNKYHRFKMCAYKVYNEFGHSGKLYITLRDMETGD